MKIIKEQVILLYGSPSVIICDNGKQFVASQFKDLALQYNSEIRNNSYEYYHPQTNPTERVNTVIGTAIASSIEDIHKEWDNNSGIAYNGHAIRNAVQIPEGHRLIFSLVGKILYQV